MEDDLELVAAVMSGGPEKFGPIVERYQDAVFAIALARLRNFHDARDIAQDVFIEAFEHLDRLHNPSRLGTWLRSITIHRCIDHLRQRRHVIDVEEIASIQEIPIGTVKRRLHDARERLKEEMMNLVEDVLKSGAPKEDFGEKVYDILSRYGRPAVPWQEWDEISSELQGIGTQGMDGFKKALESPNSRTRVFTLRMLPAFGLSDEAVEDVYRKCLTDPNKKVRKMAFMALFNRMLEDEGKREELMPDFLSFLIDRSKKIRWGVAWYVCYVGDLARHVPLDRVVSAYLDEKDPRVRGYLEGLMRIVLKAHEDQKK